MNGIELSKSYYKTFGEPMLRAEFPDLLPYIAVGFVGSGSDRYGFDDDISRDHDFEPGFCIFLPDETIVDRKSAFRLERAYAKLPKEHLGVKRQILSPVGGNRNGVLRTAEFYLGAVGSETGTLSVDAWLHIPDYALAEATNGEVFFDEYGEFSAIRKSLSEMPLDIRKKRLAGNILLMAQAGQYNFERCIRHGEPEAAQLALNEFVLATMRSLFLLNKKYMPYYKWCFKALQSLPCADVLHPALSSLLFGDNSNPTVAMQKCETVEFICGMVIDLLHEQKLTSMHCADLERHAYSVNDKITDNEIRSMHILSGI